MFPKRKRKQPKAFCNKNSAPIINMLCIRIFDFIGLTDNCLNQSDYCCEAKWCWYDHLLWPNMTVLLGHCVVLTYFSMSSQIELALFKYINWIVCFCYWWTLYTIYELKDFFSLNMEQYDFSRQLDIFTLCHICLVCKIRPKSYTFETHFKLSHKYSAEMMIKWAY